MPNGILDIITVIAPEGAEVIKQLVERKAKTTEILEALLALNIQHQKENTRDHNKLSKSLDTVCEDISTIKRRINQL
jgi:hypothetical protein